MHVRLSSNTLIFVVAMCATIPIGCEQQPAPAPQKPVLSGGSHSTASQPSSAELAALRSFVGGDQKPDATGLPPGHPPIPRSSPPRMSAPTGGIELKFTAPENWKSTPPINTMRKAQYLLPRSEGDSEDAELVVYYFGPGEGGNVSDNLERWRGQMTQADGSPLPASAAKEEHFEANGLKIALLDVSGRFAPGPMPGIADVGPRDAYRMFAAVIQTSAGPWFVKATGPGRTMEANRQAMRDFVASVRP
jgi:hypothetical protein